MNAKHDSPWLWFGLPLLVGAAGACLLSLGLFEAEPEPAPLMVRTLKPAAPTEAMTGIASPKPEDPEPRFPPEFFRRYPPGTRIPMRIPYVREGIEVSPGQFLPPLNGVRLEDGIPAIRRDPRMPPPGPVVAKVVGPDGQEYWEHEDGSYTSCTYSQIQTADGTRKEIVATQHGASQRHSFKIDRR